MLILSYGGRCVQNYMQLFTVAGFTFCGKSFAWKQIIDGSAFILNDISGLFSLTCRQPFEGAEGNLQRLLEKNRQWLEEHCNSQNDQVEDTSSIHHAEHIHRLVARFLLLIDIWFFDKTMLIESHQVRLLTKELPF
jgi:hypothetical protein